MIPQCELLTFYTRNDLDSKLEPNWGIMLHNVIKKYYNGNYRIQLNYRNSCEWRDNGY